MAGDELYTVTRGEGPLLATAVHCGHELRPEVADLMILDEAMRLRGEDPYTDGWTVVAPTRLIPHRSRFEVDLNRDRDRAVYVHPEDAWGLELWRETPSLELVQRSLAEWDAFYRQLQLLCDDLKARYGHFIDFDLHSYNHRRHGPGEPPEAPRANPEVNVGTGRIDRERWAPLVERFMADLRACDYRGRHLDVRENVKFIGRQLPRWVDAQYPGSGCCLAVEFKKFFMDEWRGEPDPEQLREICRALDHTVPGLLEELSRR